MAHPIPHEAAPKAGYKDVPQRRSERLEPQLDLRHKAVRTGVAAGGLLALIGVAAAWLMA